MGFFKLFNFFFHNPSEHHHSNMFDLVFISSIIFLLRVPAEFGKSPLFFQEIRCGLQCSSRVGPAHALAGRRSGVGHQRSQLSTSIDRGTIPPASYFLFSSDFLYMLIHKV